METNRTCPVCGASLPERTPEGLCPRCVLRAGLGTGISIGTGTGDGAPGGRFVPPSDDEISRRFPQLEILGLIGCGGMGAVYKVRQKQLDRVVALKILPPDIGGSASFAERFTREAKALAKLNHPNIVVLYEFGQTASGGDAEPLFHFLMEFIDGVNLRQSIDAGRLAPDEALAIVPQICEALQYAHDRGVVHRDIKPENILLSRDGRVKIADFGVAKIIKGDRGTDPESREAAERGAATSSENGSPTLVVGTPDYMAPEQKSRPLEVDHRADIYSLGVVLYQMLTGELPSENFQPPSRKVRLDVRIDEIVLRALDVKPEQRYQTAAAFQTEVETVATRTTRDDAKQPEGPFTSSATKRLFHRIVDSRIGRIAAVFSLLLIVGSVALVAIRGGWDAAERDLVAAQRKTDVTAPPEETGSPSDAPPSENIPGLQADIPNRFAKQDRPSTAVAETQGSGETPGPATLQPEAEKEKLAAVELKVERSAYTTSDQTFILSTDDADAQGLVFWDIETGKHFTAPMTVRLLPGARSPFVDLTPELDSWIKSTDVDIVFRFSATSWDRVNLDTEDAIAPGSDDPTDADAYDAIGIFELKDRPGIDPEVFRGARFGNDYIPGHHPPRAFRTRLKTMGLCQIEPFDDMANARKGVIIHLRTLRPRESETESAPSAKQATHDAPISAPDPEVAPFPGTSLIARLEAARSLGSNGDRDQALRTIALDASFVGEGAVALIAVEELRSRSTQDEAAFTAARNLSLHGNHAQAVEMSKKIGGHDRRDETFSFVAAKAAADGEWLICLKVLDRIGSRDSRDHAAEASARALAKMGRTSEALEIARRISSSTGRDTMLGELAR